MKSTFEEEIEKHGKLMYTCVGYSMMPMLRQRRDLVVIEKPQGRCRRYDVVLYKRDTGKYVLHRVLKTLPDGYVICGDNCWRREFDITDRHIIGVLTGFVRDGVSYTPDDKRYRLYVHIWCDLFWIRAAILRTKQLLGRLKRLIGGYLKNEKKK